MISNTFVGLAGAGGHYYYGSRNVVMSPDGTRLFWTGAAYNANLNEIGYLGEEIYGTTAHGDLARGNLHVFNVSNGQSIYTWPFTTSVMAVSGDQQKVFLFNTTTKQFVTIPMISIALPSTQSPRASLTPAFIQIDELKHRLHRARWQADLRQTLIQPLRPGIAPAAFGHERIPHFDFLLARLTAIRERPREQLLITAPFERFRFERRVIDVEETAAAPVKSSLHRCSSHGLPPLGQFPRRSEPDLVQHATEINDALDLIERAAKSGNKGRVRKRHA
jgi:hypothetical protein